MSIVADYSAGFPGAQALKAAGFIGAVRYIGSPGNVKCTTAAERQDFEAHGLGMALVFEQSAGQWRGGYAQGRSDAFAARGHANAIGFRPDQPIYFAVDQDVVSESEFGAVEAYADGWASVLTHNLCGPYGEFDVVQRLWNRGFKYTWQCRAWSGDRFFAQRRLYQYYGSPYTQDGRNVVVNGVEVDTNEVNNPDWGQTGGDEVSAAEVWQYPLAVVQPDGSTVPRLAGDVVRYSELANRINRDIANEARDIARRVEVKVDALTSELSDDEADILAAIRDLPAGTGGGPSLDQIKATLRQVFADAGEEA